jgi:Septum formation
MDRAGSGTSTPAVTQIPQQRAGTGPQPAIRAAGPDRPGPPASGPAPRRRTDVFAAATFLTGVAALIPLTAALGAVALARTARPGARGRRLAVAGLAAAGAWLVGGAAVAVVLVTQHAPARPVSLPQIFSARTGQCLDLRPNEMAGVHAVSCAMPHDAEVFGTFRVAGHRYPGVPALRRDAGSGCASRLTGYLNPQLASSGLTESYVYPDAGAWAAGERAVVCTIRSSAGQLTGSLRGLPG